ncbi:MAG TPA: hypothetical protein VF590_02565 [Isosphaeraceae bacterium]|jgi:hypothetical protein
MNDPAPHPADGADRETVPCAFRRGAGTDPYNVLSELSTCACRGGRGTVHVPAAHVRCVYCQGSGSHKTYRCPVCGGSGVVAAPRGPTETCPDCRGTACESSSGLVCLRCHGHGVLAAEASPRSAAIPVPITLRAVP